MPTVCRDCDTPIVFRRTVNDVPMPIDAAPSPQGNCRLTGRNVEVLAGDLLLAARLAEEPLHLSHHVTCPAVAARRALKKIDTDTGLRQGALF